MNDPAIFVSNLEKKFSKIKALDGVSFSIKRGSITALLGPNGAGKSTLIKILTTLLKPDYGEARVLGYDVVSDAKKVRSIIGLAGQSVAVDEILTGAENLELIGNLHHLNEVELQIKKSELLNQFELLDVAHRIIKTYSGGMRRRLDLALSLISRPEILFLDEPTTGLDPRARLNLWSLIKGLVGSGTTILLTTQYLEEADRLADDILVIDKGKIIAHGTPHELKSRIGREGTTLDDVFLNLTNGLSE